MQKTIFITGSTDGIGLETAKRLVAEGHHVLLHGRNPEKLKAVQGALSSLRSDGRVEGYLADLSSLRETRALARTISEQSQNIDVLINNAGVFKTSQTITEDGLDVRFVVNTLAPYLLTQALLPLLKPTGQVINLSSAAQSPVDLEALSGNRTINDDFEAYAQSKLALIMWTFHMVHELQRKGPVLIAVNPGSLLATKMVREGFNIAGNDIGIGADILCRMALEDAFQSASGRYFDNDVGRFSDPHPDALDPKKNARVVQTIGNILEQIP
ncbi:MAG: SDR family NAD(P)-dependent oxidoreductase [Gammaproteobacteria bacterium]|nr:MAG: SDR family NAD(P)-dependent oxidoreductase [Gammaproteobacteria bacterium]